MPRIERSLKMNSLYGLHARPSTLLAGVAGRFRSEIRVGRVEATESVNAKSILELMTLGVEKDQVLRVVANGDDAQAAMDAIVRLFERDFDESQSGRR